MSDEGKKHDAESIRQVNTYVDDAGRRVHEFVQMYGKKRDQKFYKGEARVIIASPNGAEQSVALEFLFEESRNLREAFRAWDEVAEEAKNKFVEEQTRLATDARNKAAGEAADRSRIVPAKTVPPIVGADGKPMIKG